MQSYCQIFRVYLRGAAGSGGVIVVTCVCVCVEGAPETLVHIVLFSLVSVSVDNQSRPTGDFVLLIGSNRHVVGTAANGSPTITIHQPLPPGATLTERAGTLEHSGHG